MAAAAFCLTLAACNEDAKPGEAMSERALFATGAQRLVAPLPTQATVSPLEAPATVIDFGPGARQPRTIELTLIEQAAAEGAYAKTRHLENGGEIAYRVSSFGGGSGGTEAMLEGRLSLGGVELSVVCHTQRELPAPRPDWCLEPLGKARIEPAE